MVRFHKDAPAGAECTSQGSERGYVLLFRSISKRGEDVTSDIEARLRQGFAEIMPDITQPLLRQFSALCFRRGQHSLRLINAKYDGPQQCEGAREPAPPAGCIQQPTTCVKIERRPKFSRLFRIGLLGEDLLPDPQVVLVEERLPPIIHGIASLSARGLTTSRLPPPELWLTRTRTNHNDRQYRERPVLRAPNLRFDAKHLRQEPHAGMLPVRIKGRTIMKRKLPKKLRQKTRS